MLPSTVFSPSLFHFPFRSSYWFLPDCEFMMAHGYVGEAGSLSLTNRPAFPLAHYLQCWKGHLLMFKNSHIRPSSRARVEAQGWKLGVTGKQSEGGENPRELWGPAADWLLGCFRRRVFSIVARSRIKDRLKLLSLALNMLYHDAYKNLGGIAWAEI